MTETVELQENGKENVIVLGTRKVFWAGLGAISMTQEELGKLANTLIERGQKVQKERQEHAEELIQERREAVESGRVQLRDNVSNKIDKAWHVVKLPSAKDVDMLNTKLEDLNAKLDELNSELAATE